LVPLLNTGARSAGGATATAAQPVVELWQKCGDTTCGCSKKNCGRNVAIQPVAELWQKCGDTT